MTGMSDRNGILMRSMVGGVFSQVFLPEHPQEQEVGDAERADVDDDAGDDLIDLVADAQPGQEQPDSDPGDHRRRDAGHDAADQAPLTVARCSRRWPRCTRR